MSDRKILEKVTLTGLRRITKERQALYEASLVLKRHGFTSAAGDAEFLSNLYSIDIRDGWQEIGKRAV